MKDVIREKLVDRLNETFREYYNGKKVCDRELSVGEACLDFILSAESLEILRPLYSPCEDSINIVIHENRIVQDDSGIVSMPFGKYNEYLRGIVEKLTQSDIVKVRDDV